MRWLPALLLTFLPATATADAWPGYLGPNGNNSALRCDAELVTRFADARFLWASDVPVPDGQCGDRRKASKDGTWPVSGGYGSPIVAGGRVYLQYYVPSGNVVDEEALAKYGPASRAKFLVEADDVIHCFDLTTGKTLWRKAFERTAMNMQAFTKGGPSLTPCVAGSRLVFHSNGGRVFCLNAATGEKLWDTRTDRYPFQEQMRTLCRKRKVMAVYNRDFKTSPRIIDGVVLLCDHRFHQTMPVKPGGRAGGGGWEYHYDLPSSLVAIDLKDGRELWRLPDGLTKSALAARWSHDGRDYAIAAGTDVVRCIEPRTGKVFWSIDVLGSRRTPCVWGDYLVVRTEAPGQTGSRKKAQHVCYRMGVAGAEKLWALPLEYGCPTHAIPTAVEGYLYTETNPRGRLLCVELATGKVVATAPADKERHFGYFLTLMGDRLICGGGDTNQMHLYNADPKSFARLDDVLMPNAWGYEMAILPALVDGRMVLRTHDRLICVDLRRGITSGKRLGETNYMATIGMGHYRVTFTPDSGEAVTAAISFTGLRATDGPTLGANPVLALGWSLRRKGSSLTGPVQLGIDEKARKCEVSTTITGGKIRGTFTGRWDGRDVKGTVTGRAVAEPAPPAPRPR